MVASKQDVNDPRYWWDRQEEAFMIADRMHGDRREYMLSVARTYGRLAVLAEQRSEADRRMGESAPNVHQIGRTAHDGDAR